MNITLLKDNFDFPAIINEIQEHGATSIPILNEKNRALLAQEARRKEYIQQEEYLPNVREQLSSYKTFEPESLYHELHRAFAKLLENAARKNPKVFSTPIVFNELVLQKYPAGSIGITPHIDYARCQNIICVFTIEGTARFCTCRDRSGTDPHEIDASPGRVILMRANGFLGSDFRPFHFIDRIPNERYTFALRQIRE